MQEAKLTAHNYIFAECGKCGVKSNIETEHWEIKIDTHNIGFTRHKCPICQNISASICYSFIKENT